MRISDWSSDVCASDLGHDAERLLQRRDVETREMEQLQPRGIGQNRFQYRRVIGAAGLEADEMLVARPVADLDEAEPVAQRVQPHGFGIDRDRTREIGSAWCRERVWKDG